MQQSATTIRKDAYWFGESQSRIVVTCTLKNAEALLSELKALDAPYEYLGIVTENNIDMEGEYWGHIDEWKELYDTAIDKLLGETGQKELKELSLMISKIGSLQ